MRTRNQKLGTIAEQVKSQVVETFPMYPVTVLPAPDDDYSLCVRVFGVPQEAISAVHARISELQDVLDEKGEVMLVPMVKSMEVTRKYYPEISGKADRLRVALIVRCFMAKSVPAGPTWVYRHENPRQTCVVRIPLRDEFLSRCPRSDEPHAEYEGYNDDHSSADECLARAA